MATSNGTNGTHGTQAANGSNGTAADTVDALIVGGGYAGLEAAQTLALQLHSSIVFDAGAPRNRRAQRLRMIPDWNGKDPAALRAAQRAELGAYSDIVSLKDAEVVSLAKVSADGEPTLFRATDAAGNVYTGRKVVLATGVQELPPPIPGYEDGWARWIFHCLYSQGSELRGSDRCGLLAVAPLCTAGMALQMAHISARVAKLVTFYTNGDEGLKADLEKQLKGNKHYAVDARKLARLSKDEGKRVRVDFEDGGSAEEDFITHMPLTRARGPFAEQLGIDITPMGDYAAKPPFEETNVKGVFATGDSSSMFKVAPIAIANASLCASGVVCRLHEEELGIPGLF